MTVTIPKSADVHTPPVAKNATDGAPEVDSCTSQQDGWAIRLKGKKKSTE